MEPSLARRKFARLTLFFRLVGAIFAMVAGCAVAARAEIVLGPAAIVASVRDADGKPVAGARVTALGPTERDGATGGAGFLTLEALPLGTYAVRVIRNGFEPLDTTVRVVTAAAPTMVAVRLTSSSFASLRDGIAVSTAPALGAGGDPFAAHAVAVAPGTQIVASQMGAGAGIAVDGASPDESRVELDGIPIAGGAQGFNALRFRNALPLSDVAVLPGPLTETPTVRDTIGGIVDYRTPDISQGVAGGVDAGYDSAFGAFQHARYTQTFGGLGVLLDTVTGGGENRAQTFKARFAVSPDVSLAVESYGSQSDSTVAGATITSDAPAFAADLRATLGGGTLRVRSFESEAHTYADGDLQLENASVRGLQFGYDVPAGQDLFSFDYDRRAEDTTFGDGSIAEQTFRALTVRGEFALSEKTGLEVADSFDAGSTFAQRSDPRVAYTVRPSARLTLRVVVGSAFATEPADAFATAALADAARSPETSLGARLRADAALGGGVTLWGSVFETRRFDRPQGLPDARTTGLELGLDRPAAAGPFTANAYLDLEHGIAAVPGTLTFDGVPASKARVAVGYRFSNVVFALGTTLLGADNAFAIHAVTLGDVSLRVPLLRLFDVRAGIENLYGARTPYAALAPLFAPREFTLTVGHSPG
jgi:hypothetical protein